jgi:Coenzyme F390 synthetase
MINAIVDKIIYSVDEKIERRHFHSILHWYMRCQYLPYKELRARQEEKMRRLIKHAYLNVPFYREKLGVLGLEPKNIATIDDLSTLPITTKQEIRKSFPNEIVAKNIPNNRLIFDKTSGSTGEPLVFYKDKHSKDYTFASLLLFNHWAGIKPGDRSVHIGMPQNFSLRIYVSNLLQRHSNISVLDLTA